VRIVEHVRRLKEEGDSTGGIICSSVYEVPVGLGEPVFDKLHAVMGHAMLSIPAVKGFEVGTGFRGVRLRGSQHNDSY
jgi:chorismate synthase